ncbi:MAG: fibronectin type III domain-containing protein [Ilumatobacteraceae bacterium]
MRYQNGPDSPTSVTAAGTATGTVTVSWSAPSYTGVGSISGYSVTQASGGSYSAVSAGTCTSAATSTATSCTVTGLTPGTSYTFKVATKTSSGTYTSVDSAATSPVTVFGDLDHFAVTATDGSDLSTQIAGTSFNVKVTAQDSGNNTVDSFAGTVDLTSTSLFVSGGGTTASFTSGELASHAVVLKRAGASQTITATQTGAAITGDSAAFTINAGAATKLQVLLPGETAAPATTNGKTGSPSDFSARRAATVTVNAVDAYWNVDSTATPTVAISTTAGSASLPANAALVSGTKDFSITIDNEGSNRTVTATDQAGSGSLTTGVSAAFTVGPGYTPQVTAPEAALFSPSTAGQDPGNFSISGIADATVLVTVGLVDPPTGTTFSLPTTTGLTLGYGYTTWTGLTDIAFTGSQADANNALAAMTVSTGSATGDVVIQVSASESISNVYYHPVLKHFYEYKASVGVSAPDAISQSSSSTRFGQDGYLVTITSVDEQNFISSKVNAPNVWIGASDSASPTVGESSSGEGAWKWVNGPEEGRQFWSGVANGSTVTLTDAWGNSVNYAPWCANEPNNHSAGEDFAVTNWNGGACWNDYPGAGTSNISGYIVEYGDTGSPTYSGVGSASLNATIIGAASKLVMVTQPAAGASEASLSTQPVVRITDADGNTMTSDSSTQVTVAASGGTLGGTTTVTAVNGVVTFTDLTFAGVVGDNYQLTFTSSPVLTSVSSANISPSGPGALASIDITTTAVGAPSGAAFTTQPSITLYDANSNVVVSDNASVVTATVSSGGTIVGTATATASSGVATFSSLGLTAASGDYTLTFTSGSLTDAQTISVSVGAATAVSLTTLADGATYGNTWTQQPAIAIVDSGGNQVTSDSSTQVTVSVSTGGSLSGTATVTVSSGVATFSGLSVTGTPGSYTLTYAASGLTAATQSLAVAKASQSITFAHPASGGATYGDVPIPVTPSSTSGLIVSLTSGNSAVCTVSGGGINIVAPGTCTITAAQAGNENYLAATSIERTFVVSKADQASLSMTSASTAVYGETITLAAAGGSGNGAVAFGVDSGSCVISNGVLTLGNVGSACNVLAIKLSDSNYNQATSQTQSISVTKAGQSLSFTSTVPSAPLSGESYTPVAVAVSTVTGESSSVVPTYAASGTCAIADGAVIFVASGPCTVTSSAAASTNFDAATDVTQTIVVGSINQNITFVRPSNSVFGSASFALEASASSDLVVSFSLSSETTNSACDVSEFGVVSVLAVGTCAVTAVQAGNDQYAEASSVTRTFQIAPALPTSPTLASASASAQAITIAFLPPGFNGGVEISAYELTATPVGGGLVVRNSSCTESPCTIGGLVNGTAYTVDVAAVNAAGTGPASSDSGQLVPATAAFSVGALSALPGDGVVDLSWLALTDEQLGGGSFTRYEVSYRKAGVSPTPEWALATDQLLTQSTNAYQVQSLDNGTSYDFQVVAITSANAEELEGNTATVVQYPATVPSEPRALSVLAATPTDVEFSWEVPLSDGGEAITGYTVTVESESPGADSPVTCTVTETTPRCRASSLSNGAVYVFSVEAVNQMSSGDNGNVASVSYSVPSSDSTLSALVVRSSSTAIALTPTFASDTTAYAAKVSNEVSSITVIPTASKDASTININGTAVTSGSASSALALDVGVNVVDVVVTASDDRFVTTYRISVTRDAPVPVPEEPSTPAPTPTTPTTPSNPDTGQTAGIGGDSNPLITDGTELVNERAVYIDDDGTMRVIVDEVVIRPDRSPSLVLGESDEMSVTVNPGEARATSYDDESSQFIIRAGFEISLEGSGYLAESPVEVWLFSTPTLVGVTNVDSDGTWTLSFTVPTSLESGLHHLQIEGTTVDGDDQAIRTGLLVENSGDVQTLPVTGGRSLTVEYVLLVFCIGALLAIISRGRRQYLNV